MRTSQQTEFRIQSKMVGQNQIIEKLGLKPRRSTTAFLDLEYPV